MHNEYWYRAANGEVIVNNLSRDVLPRHRDWVLRGGAPSTNIRRNNRVLVTDREGRTMQLRENDIAGFVQKGLIWSGPGGYRLAEKRGATWATILAALGKIN